MAAAAGLDGGHLPHLSRHQSLRKRLQRAARQPARKLPASAAGGHLPFQRHAG